MRVLIVAAFGMLAAAPAYGCQYLYTWAMETHDPATATPPAESMGRAFLAVFDVAEDSTEFGRLVAMLPVGSRAQMAHHTNYDMPADGHLLASDYMAGEGYVFDLRKAEKPRLLATFGNAGPYAHPHSFERIANGHTLATCQFNGAPDQRAGPWSNSTTRVTRYASVTPPIPKSNGSYAPTVCGSWRNLIGSSPAALTCCPMTNRAMSSRFGASLADTIYRRISDPEQQFANGSYRQNEWLK